MNEHELVLNPMVTWASPGLRNPHIMWLLEPNNFDHLRKTAQCGPGEPCMHPTLNWEPPSLGASSAAQPHEMKNSGRFGERSSSPSKKNNACAWSSVVIFRMATQRLWKPHSKTCRLMPQVWPQHDKIQQSAPAFRVLWAESRSSNIMVRRQKPGAHRVTSIIDDSDGSSKKKMR